MGVHSEDECVHGKIQVLGRYVRVAWNIMFGRCRVYTKLEIYRGYVNFNGWKT